MLCVKVRTEKDLYGGTGLFAAQDIPAGSLFWSYDPAYTRFVSPESYFSALPQERAMLSHFGYPVYAPDDAVPMKGVLLNLDAARFTNHSDNPNTGHPPDDPDVNIALRLIREGEEITCNYFEFDPADAIHAMGIATCKSFLLGRGSLSEQQSGFAS